MKVTTHRRKVPAKGKRGKVREGLFTFTTETPEWREDGPDDDLATIFAFIGRAAKDADVKHWLAKIAAHAGRVLEGYELPKSAPELGKETPTTREHELLPMFDSERRGQPEYFAATVVRCAETALQAIRDEDTELAVAEAVRATNAYRRLEFCECWEYLVLRGLEIERAARKGSGRESRATATKTKQAKTDALVGPLLKEIRARTNVKGVAPIIQRKLRDQGSELDAKTIRESIKRLESGVH